MNEPRPGMVNTTIFLLEVLEDIATGEGGDPPEVKAQRALAVMDARLVNRMREIAQRRRRRNDGGTAE